MEVRQHGEATPTVQLLHLQASPISIRLPSLQDAAIDNVVICPTKQQAPSSQSFTVSPVSVYFRTFVGVRFCGSRRLLAVERECDQDVSGSQRNVLPAPAEKADGASVDPIVT